MEQSQDANHKTDMSHTNFSHKLKPFPKPESEATLAAPTRLEDAIVCLKNISREYRAFCDVMMTMPERKSELKAGDRFMDALEALRDELLKRKSSNKTP